MIETFFSTQLPVDEQFALRRHVLRGKGRKGRARRFCIVTGTHGDELEGQMVCYEVGRRVMAEPERLCGTLEIYPALNPLGIDTIQRGIPNFDLDMNRIFPGDPQGSMAEQAAYSVVQELQGADMVIDIHSSNLYLRETPQVRINVLHEAMLVPHAITLGVDFVWVHDAATVLEATLAHTLNQGGTPCLVVEMGVGQRINHKMCNRLVDGIFRLMAQMGLWQTDSPVPSGRAPIVCRGDSVAFLNAAVSGVFLTEKKTGENVAQGEEIGQIVSPLTSQVLCRVTAPCSGYLFTLRAYPIVYEGSLMARIYKIPHEQDETKR